MGLEWWKWQNAFPSGGGCSPSLPSPGITTRDYYPETNDLFYLELRYDQLFANNTAGGDIGSMSGTAQKAGNISQMAWRVRGRDRQAYSFTYDHLSRMTAATYYDVNSSNTATNTSRFNESLTYDLRGNISSLQRQGYYSSSCNYGQIDNLAYTYTPSTNRIATITESAPATQKSHGFNPGSGGAGYTYDGNGNMITDNHKKMTIAYNHLNLPKKITYDSGSWIEFTYDAMGRKLTKTTNTGVIKNYIGTIEYSGANLEAIYHSEGRLTPNGGAFYTEYAIKDHLGNSRMMFRANGVSAQILQESHQHPFGMEMEASYYAGQVGTENGYKYNGKELNEDFGLNWYDYGARWYDPAIGRFIGVDPIADKFAHVSPYNYAENRAVNGIDLWGLQYLDANLKIAMRVCIELCH